MNLKTVMGIDIGGTYIRMGIVNEAHALSQFKIIKTKSIFTVGNPTDKLIQCIKNYLGTVPSDQIPCAISVGLPSTIDKTRKIVVNTPNIENFSDFQNIPLVELLEKALQIPVYINRDVNYLFMFDLVNSEVDKNGIILGFYIGTGIGNVISINGNLLLGKNGVAAELGHTPVLGANELCGCGNRGCIETLASGKYLKMINDRKFPETHISKVFTLHCDDPEIMAFIDHVSIPIATEINIFDPDYVIIGGGIVHMDDFPIWQLENCIRKHVRKPYPEQNIEFLYSSAAQENGVIGAGIYAFSKCEVSTH